MKGRDLNQERWRFLNDLEKMLEDVQEQLRSAKSDYHRFDEFDEYRDDYYQEYVGKMAQAKVALSRVIEVVSE